MTGKMSLVVVESPFGHENPVEVQKNIDYARACLADCLERGEAPYASHLLYTQPGILRDEIPEERERGIRAGLAWGDRAHLRAVYVDRGISKGMQLGIDRAVVLGQGIEYRRLGGAWVTKGNAEGDCAGGS